MKVIKIRNQDQKGVIQETLAVLRQRGLVIFPSDTVYGLLVDATNEKAVKKLLAFKNRPPGKPISVFVADLKMARDYVYIGENQQKILEKIFPGPFTVILNSRRKVCPLIESERRTLGIRMPSFPLVLELVREFGKPITATSANIFGRPPHYRISTLLSELPNKKKLLVDLVVDAGHLPRNKPSTVVDITQPEFKILRKGDIVFTDEKNFYSKSPSQTRRVAYYLVEKIAKSTSKPLVVILKGDIGTGKTVFVKGIGEALGVKNIVSPSYVTLYEYPIDFVKYSFKKLIHIDFYNLQEEKEIDELKLEREIVPGNLLAIEWGEKGGKLLPLFKDRAQLFFVEIEYLSKRERKIVVNY
ncbi:MAG: L-threonylcarbamoyladenylate synthase [Patescibacteria group bacterium]|nr:L-threonylcarbamoyladenylate synthase [Patescibacteria group bacterium]